MKRTQLYMWMYMHVSSLAVRCDVRRTHSDNDVSKGGWVLVMRNCGQKLARRVSNLACWRAAVVRVDRAPLH